MVAKRVEKHIKSVISWFPGCFELASLTQCETLDNSLNRLADCGGTRTLSRTFGKMCSSQCGLLIDKKRVAMGNEHHVWCARLDLAEMQQQLKCSKKQRENMKPFEGKHGKHETPRGKT